VRSAKNLSLENADLSDIGVASGTTVPVKKMVVRRNQ
jgi:hypothetical protein